MARVRFNVGLSMEQLRWLEGQVDGVRFRNMSQVVAACIRLMRVLGQEEGG